MPVTVGVNQMSVAHKSSHPGASVQAFPDVCWMPTKGAGAPVPIPYPNLAGPGITGAKATAGKMARSQFLRNQMHSLHGQLWGLPGGNPNHWHKLVDQYVIATAELYKTLSE